MPLTDVERYLFRGRNLAHWVTGFGFDGQQVQVVLAPIADDPSRAKPFAALFGNAVILSIEEDMEERDSWPLNLIGFDCYPIGSRWKFVLNCGTVEWIWESDWPTLVEDR